MGLTGRRRFNWVLLCNLMIAICLLSRGSEIYAGEKVTPYYYDQKQFPMPGIIKQKVAFWEQIFYRFPSTTSVIHDANHPERILDIVDHVSIAKQKDRSVSFRKEREKLNELYLKRYNLAIERFRKHGKLALQYGAIEKRVYNVYKRGKNRLSELYSGKLKIRVQTGLADEFVKAASRAQDYLPYMERAFRAKGVPTRITRLAFVESMFNENALSKVGASGMWQFMPSTAKSFMNVNHVVDERNSPFIAAKGAAALMQSNYRILKSWPLAITAYNHGAGGVKKAIRKVGTRNLGVIVDNYESGSFGFASRNFYAEFLAAANVYDYLIKTKKVKRRPSRLNLTSVRLKRRVSTYELLKHTPLTQNTLQKFNKSIKKKAFTSKKHAKLPQNFELFVPTNLIGHVRLGLNKLQPRKRYAAKSKPKKWKRNKSSSSGKRKAGWVKN